MDQEQKPEGAYLKLVLSHVLGFNRFAQARIAALSLQNVVMAFRSPTRTPTDGSDGDEVFQRLRAISFAEYDSFEYVNDVMSLVYLTTLLDTFLSDTTKFLLLLYPASIGKSQSVSLEAVLSARSTADLVNDAASKKGREISYLPISARLEFLHAKFGFQLQLQPSVLDDASKYWELRNAAVHDQGMFECEVCADGRIHVTQKACPRHPTRIRMEDVAAAEQVYSAVVWALCRSVVEQVLKCADDPTYRQLWELRNKQITIEEGRNG